MLSVKLVNDVPAQQALLKSKNTFEETTLRSEKALPVRTTDERWVDVFGLSF